jgi:hypothetical protein
VSVASGGCLPLATVAMDPGCGSHAVVGSCIDCHEPFDTLAGDIMYVLGVPSVVSLCKGGWAAILASLCGCQQPPLPSPVAVAASCTVCRELVLVCPACRVKAQVCVCRRPVCYLTGRMPSTIPAPPPSPPPHPIAPRATHVLPPPCSCRARTIARHTETSGAPTSTSSTTSRWGLCGARCFSCFHAPASPALLVAFFPLVGLWGTLEPGGRTRGPAARPPLCTRVVSG